MVGGKRRFWVRIPPPLSFVTAFAAGRLLERWLPAPALRGLVAKAWPLGVLAIVGGVALAGTAPILFALDRTTIVPHRTARALVTRGAYRVTRNPMYLGLALVYVGVAVATGAYGALATLVAPLWILNTAVIPYEEADLQGAFGDDYRRYSRRVRRWLGWRES